MVYTYKQKKSPQEAKAPYAQIKDKLRAELFAGDWAPGVQMPSEADLVSRFKVSRMTINRALRELQADGLIERVQGVGTFAAHASRIVATLGLRDLHEEVEARGHTHQSVVHLLRREVAGLDLAIQLGLPSGSDVFHSLITHYENGMALQLEDRYVNPACAPDYLKQDFTLITPTRHLFQATPYVEATYSVEATNANKQEAGLLSIEVGAACLVVVRRTTRVRSHSGQMHSEGITLVRLIHPGSRYTLKGQFQ